MKIEEHVSELLFEHDCVIVPDFGGFVCNYSPARIDPVKHLFEPPAKRILFNKGLTRNDGLLAHHIAGKLRLPYSDALEAISEEVARCKETIEKEKRLTLEEIGLLYLDEKGNLLFQQDNKINYLQESFGLATFYHLPAETANAEAKTKVIPIYNERKKTRIYAAAAVIATLVVSAFCFSLMEKQTNMRFSGFNFFSKKAPALYSYSPGIYKKLPEALFNTNDVPHIFITEPIKAALPVVAKSTPAISKTVPATTNNPAVATPGTFSIILGSFSIKENAENLVREYAKQNLNVSILGRNGAGLYMVGYGSFTSHNDAMNERVNFQKKFNKDSWVKGN